MNKRKTGTDNDRSAPVFFVSGDRSVITGSVIILDSGARAAALAAQAYAGPPRLRPCALDGAPAQ